MTHQQFHPKIVLNTMEQLIPLFKKNISCILVLNKSMLTFKTARFLKANSTNLKIISNPLLPPLKHMSKITDKWGAEFLFHSCIFSEINMPIQLIFECVPDIYTEKEELVKRQELINNSGLTLIIICNFKGLSFTKLTT